MQRLIGNKVLSVMKKGSSRPIIVEDKKGNTYLVKLRSSLSNPYASVSDFLACKIGFELGLPIICPQILFLNDEMDLKNVDEETRDAVRKSHGWNIAYPFLENATDILSSQIPRDNNALKDLFLYDLFLLNIDRTSTNTNIIQVGTRYMAFDFETAFLILGILQGKNYASTPSVWASLKQNPLYFDIEINHFEVFQTLLKEINLKSIIDEIPDEWLNEMSDFKDTIEIAISKIIDDKNYYSPIIGALKSVEIENDEDRKKRILENRLKFEESMKI